MLQFGAMNYSWTALQSVDLSDLNVTISYNTTYELTLYAEGTDYYVYLDDMLAMNFTDTKFTTGSIGIRTFSAVTTVYSLTYSRNFAVSVTPSTTVAGITMATSDSVNTSSSTWYKDTGKDPSWYVERGLIVYVALEYAQFDIDLVIQ